MTLLALSLAPKVSSRAERPGFFLRAAVWRAGSRSRGISLRALHEATP
jgi:hypothetical protein